MSENLIKKIRTAEGDLQIDYNALANLPDISKDWNQNDPTADDYIKNRPFYSEYEGQREVVHKLDKKYLPDDLAEGFAAVAKTGSYNDLIDQPNVSDVVRYSTQSLTTSQKNQARNNIGAGTSNFSGDYNDLTNTPDISDVVRFSQQNLDASQQEQARTNIGAGTSNFSGDYNDLTNIPEPEYNYIILKDQVNNCEYFVRMVNGNLVSFCKAVSIEITTNPNKTVYYEDDSIDLTGMELSITCQDGTTRFVNSGYECNPTVVTATTSNIEITYKEGNSVYTALIPVTVTSMADLLGDFGYTTNSDGTYTLTSWNGTSNGSPSTEFIVPDNNKIIV